MNHLIALFGVVLIGMSPIWVVLAGVSPATATFYRCAYALPALLAIWFVGRKRDNRSPRMRLMAFASGVIVAADLTIWHYSIELIGAGLSTVLANIQVVFVGLLAWLFHRERPTRLAFQVIPVIFIGATLISGLAQDDAYGKDPVSGAILAAFSGLLYGSFLLLFRASNRVLAPPAGPLLDASAGGAITALAVGPLLPDFELSVTWPTHGYLVALALGSQVVGWLFITYVLPRLAALETSLLLLLQPIFAVAVAALWLGERISALQGFGIFLVISGLGYLSTKGAIKGPQEKDDKWSLENTISRTRASSSRA